MFELASLKITPFRETEHLSLIPQLTEILHESYKPLADQGFLYSASYQPPENTLKRIKSGEGFLAFWDDLLIGTITLIGPRADNPCEYYQRDGVYHFGQFAVKPGFQGRGIANELLLFIEKRVKQLNGKELALDTAEGALGLIETYKRRGFIPVSTVKWKSTNYQSIVMRKEIPV